MANALLPLRSRLREALHQGLGSHLVSGFLWVAVLTVFGKGISFVKDAAVARWFGTQDEMDAFVLAFGFLGFAASVLGGGLPEAFLPHYTGLKHRRGPHRAWRLGTQVAVVQAFVLIACAVLIWLTAAPIMDVTAQRFSDEKKALSVELLRRLLPFLVTYGLSLQLSIWLRAEKVFALTAAAPMIIPTSILLALISGTSIDALVTGTIVGSTAQLLLLCTVLLRDRPSPASPGRYRLKLREPALSASLRDALPYLMSGIIYSSTTLIDQGMAAALLSSGAVSVLSYAEKLVGVLLAFTAIPAGEVLFPYFADLVARRDWSALRTKLKYALLLVGGLSIPATVMLSVLAPQIVGLFFERGAFTPADTTRVAEVMRIAVWQVPFYIIGTLCSRVAVALQAPRFILGISIFSMIANAGLNWLLLRPLGAAGIALSTVLVILISSFIVLIYVRAQIRRHEAVGTCS